MLNESIEHLQGTLRVANVIDLFCSSDVLNDLYFGSKVIRSHFCNCEVPSYLFRLRVVEVDIAVLRPSTVGEPYIIALLLKGEEPWLTDCRVT